ncbi:hypothetical protein Are01nite_89680 [Actinoplanes regularis]|nr:hypothetical protein Are01nite_89680 [Actinoplanes regularis]
MDLSGQDPQASEIAARRLLILDVCGVLLGEPMKPLFQAVASQAGTSQERVAAVFRHFFRDALWSGRLDEADFWPAFSMACGVGIPSPTWPAVLRSAMMPLPAAACVSRWSRSAQVWLLSNHRHEWLVPALQDVELHLIVRRVLISSQTGHVKPGPAAYVQVLDYAAPGDALLYVDDHEANVDAFRELGVDGIVADKHGDWIRSVDAWLGMPSRSGR